MPYTDFFYNMAIEQDVHGNVVHRYPGGTDTIGRSPLTVTQPNANQLVYSWYSSAGTQVQYTVNLVDLAIHTDFASTEGLQNGYTPYIGTRKVVQSIQTPQGNYSFQYNTDAEITQMIMPTGAEIDYVWDYYNHGCPGGGSPTARRSVISRTVHNGSSSATWNFSYCENSYTKVIFPANASGVQAETDYTYSGTRIVGVRQLASAGGSPLRTYSMTYTASQVDGNPSHLGSITTTLDNGLVSKREFDYDLFAYMHNNNDCSGQTAEQNCELTINNGGSALPLEQLAYVPGSRGNVTAIREYDWGQGSPGPLIRQTLRNYLTEQNNSYFQDVEVNPYGIPGISDYSFTTRNIVDRVSSETVYDGSAVCSGVRGWNGSSSIVMPSACTANKLSQVTVEYDNGTPATTGYFGEPTAITKWLHTPGASDSTVTTRYAYDTYGNVTSVTDPKGNSLSASYTDSFSSTGSGACPLSGSSHAYPTQITNALGQSASISYYPCTGMKSVELGPNDIANSTLGTRYSYDFLGRPVDVLSSDNGHVHTDYDDVNRIVTTTTAQDASTSVVKKSTSDTLGQVIQSQLVSDPAGIVYVDTSYDALGQVNTVSNPYRASETTYGVSQSFYDALGRKVEHLNQDGSTQTFSYTGNTTASTDEAGNTHQHTSDALGRLIKVVEPGGLNTTYSYDPLGNMKCADQWGTATVGSPCSGVRTRSFTYDSLSRLITSQNPETGTICYGTWDNGICKDGYDANGNLLKKADANANVATYTYDSLNRPLDITYSDDTPGQHYRYDQTSVWMGPQLNTIGRLTQAYTDWDMRHPLSGALPCRPQSSAVANFHQNFGNPTYCNWTDELFSYDVMGRLIRKGIATPSEAGWAAHGWEQDFDLAGNPTTLTYPQGYQVTSAYDSAGRLQRVYAGTPASPAGEYYRVDSFHPDGTPAIEVYGGLIQNQLQINSRLQPCLQAVSNGSMFLEREYFYGSSNTVGQGCNAAANDNGNLQHIVDRLGGSYTQDFTYDPINRIQTWNAPLFAGSLRSQSFHYDSFGNINQTNNYPPGTPPDPLTFPAVYNPVSWPYDANNRLVASAFNCFLLSVVNDPSRGALPAGPSTAPYDAAGNILCGGSQNSDAKAYVWDAAGRLNQLWKEQGNNNYSPAAYYTYDANGARMRSDQITSSDTSPNFREYFPGPNGQTLTERDEDWNWTNYIYAGSKRVAKVSNVESRLILHGTNSSAPGQNRVSAAVIPFAGLEIRTGDVIRFRQCQQNAHGGLLTIFSDGTYGNWVLGDQYGPINDMSINGQWVNRVIPLDGSGGGQSFVGKTLSQTFILNEADAPDGDFGVWLDDIVITRANGDVVQIYHDNGVTTAQDLTLAFTNPLVTNESAQAEHPAQPDWYISQYMPVYMISDQVGTTQMEFNAAGWPIWKGEFAPFGQELDAADHSVRYKFTGKERDAESGLDYFGARYYASSMGRFVSPDWAEKPEDVPYAQMDDPQSLNLYGYVRNNPLSRVDKDGHQQEEAAEAEAEGAVLRNARNALRPITPEYAEAIGWPVSQITPTPEQMAMRQKYLSTAGGRWGGAPTRNQNASIADLFTDAGYKIVGGVEAREEWLPGPNGSTKGGTFVDLTVRNEKETVRIQTVDVTSDGRLTPNEAAAAARIRAKYPNDKLILVAKTTPRRPASADPVVHPKVK